MNEIDVVGGMTRLQLQPGDLLVVTSDRTLSVEGCASLRRHVQAAFGREVPVLVLDGGIKVGAVNANEVPA